MVTSTKHCRRSRISTILLFRVDYDVIWELSTTDRVWCINILVSEGVRVSNYGINVRDFYSFGQCRFLLTIMNFWAVLIFCLAYVLLLNLTTLLPLYLPTCLSLDLHSHALAYLPTYKLYILYHYLSKIPLNIYSLFHHHHGSHTPWPQAWTPPSPPPRLACSEPPPLGMCPGRVIGGGCCWCLRGRAMCHPLPSPSCLGSCWSRSSMRRRSWTTYWVSGWRGVRERWPGTCNSLFFFHYCSVSYN